MRDTALETLLRRDRAIVAAALVTLAAISWIYILWLASAMDMAAAPASHGSMDMGSAMDMPMDMPMSTPMETQKGAMTSMSAATVGPWTAATFAYAFIMWAVMMVGMMVPSATPMILLYARVGRQAAQQGKPFAATGFFAIGYLSAWILFALVAVLGQWLLDRALLLTPALASASAVLSGIVLIAVGLFQFTPLKDRCLSQCQAPLLFIQNHGGFRRKAVGAFGLGVRHGLYCVGCCWALMALLFVGGVMNVLWIAAIAIFVLAEKVVPGGRILSRIAGVALFLAGLWQLTALL
ncbi:DUF2182 domain-containing protein [Ensifer adhaerens]|uniref:DUF2182 domain-containing protein n=1 Tax=Ensifer adhaerens TaxID=106592 RepID=UPI001CC135D1|nr:DUF2182 domain-containing protein [Ensifer adhaerens]MBZ7923886.1 DUF2182 domain-containing protein [Ensifer adhaerens]UAX92423.1 DUF2182 domain-containing protein [Ensifer adhaerens]UAY00058.1 DUF2182 domain-containing protein [Ensifer adhaerens]UAY07441.1 DUF2182 domain-containing protein [Ensifer adhaerens]